jgi:hypothetical protein
MADAEIQGRHARDIIWRLRDWAGRVRTGAQLAIFSLFAVLMYWATVFLMRLGSGRTPDSVKFAGTVEFDAWTGILGVNVAVWIMVAVWLWPQGMDWRRERDHIGVMVPVLIYVALTGLMYQGLAQVQSRVAIPLFLGYQRTHVLTLLAFGCAMPGVLGVWRLSARLHTLREKLKEDPEPLPSGTEFVSTLRECRLNLLHCVVGVGAIITGTVLAGAALRAAVYAAHLPASHYTFRAMWLLFFGAYFTAVLALVAVPAFVSWRTVAVAYVARVYPVPADGRLPEGWEAGRSALKRLLHIERLPLEVAGNVLGLLAPLLTAVLGAFVSVG